MSSHAAAAASPDPGPPFAVKIVGFNDFHGNLQSPGTFGANTTVPVADRPPVGGAEFIAAHVARLRAQNPLNVVVGAGDSIGATPLISALFFDEPAVETLNRIGLEFNAVGNHEFDKGSDGAAAPAERRLQDHQRPARSRQLQGRDRRHAGAFRRRQVQVALGQRLRHGHGQHAAAGLRREDASTTWTSPSSA